jgi:hypothetical protein
MTLKRAFIGIPLAFEDPKFHFLRRVESGTMARIDTCFETLSSLDPDKKNSAIVVTANHPPGKQSTPSMCGKQLRLIELFYPPDTPVHVKPHGWGTESEIESAIKIVKDKFADYDITLVIATNRAHMWRVKLLVSMYKPERWKCVFAVAKHNFSLWYHLREIPATLITLGKWVLSKDNI